MGVPSLFRWLSERYPKIIADAIEASAAASDGAGVDASERNPNGVEYDNLYLDMNGIIHPCSHPDSGPKPTCMEDIMDNMFAYIDRIFNIVRPRKLVFLAIDGVAPRAKMNQQRSRRFRAAKDARQLKENAAQKKELMERKGIKIDEPDGKPFSFDTNTITPGTHFMAKVTESLKYYIVDRMRRKGWHGVKVILSDSNIPGEGEHKIMDFIRSQRAQPTYDPNVKHVIYGLDADLIMLALATHEAHFYVLREEVTQNRNNCSLCGQPGHFARNCQGFAREKLEAGVDAHSFLVKPFQFLVVPVLKEYLKRDLFVETPFGFDAERAVDDWVFLCFLVGNDFLPHLPTLKIFEGAIAMLMKFYKKLLPTFDGYITENGEVDLARFELIMNEIGQVEDTILKNRRQKEQRQQHNRSRYQRGSGEGNNNIAGIMLQGGPSNQSAAERIRNSIRGSGDQGPFSSSSTSSSSPSTSSSAVPLDSSMGVHLSTSTDGAAAVERAAPSFSDVVQLGEQGARDRYYDHKFGVSVSDSAALERIAFSYIEGLVWVLKYYYQGCCSWEWYYPYYHAPFSLDLVKLSHFKFEFNLGKPFSPFEQLMAVLPADSCQALPECYHRLMKSDDSPIIDFYPSDFDIDMDGCSQAWMGVSLLPFIDQKRLLREVRALESQLTPEERERNTRGHDFFFFHSSDKLALSENVTTILNNRKKLIKMEKPTRFEIDPVLSGGIFGQFFVCKTAVPVSSFIQGPYSKFPAIQNQVIYFHYRRPKLPPGLVHHAVQLPGAVPPPPLLDSVDLSFQPDDWSLGGPRGYQNRSGYSNQTSDRRAEYGRQEGFHREMQLNDEVNRDYNKPHHQQHGHHDSGHKRPRDDRDHHYQQRHEGSHHDNKRPRYDNQQSAPHQRYANHQSQSQSSSDPQGYRQPRFAAQPPSLPYGRPQEQQQYGQQQQYGGYSNPYQQQQPYGQQQQQQQQQQQYGGYSNPYQQQQRGGPQQPPYSQQQQGGGSSYQQNPRDPRLRGPPGDQR